MIEAKVNISKGKKEVYISQLNGGLEEIAGDLVTILDRILTDELIKISPKNMAVADEEKIKIITNARRKVLKIMYDYTFSEKDYIYSEETSLYLQQKYADLKEIG